EAPQSGTRWCPHSCNVLTAPAIGMVNPSAATISSGPRTKPGHASARSKSAQVARCGAKVLVSCWNPPTAIRAMCSLQYGCRERAKYNRRAGRGEPAAAATGEALRARTRETEKDQDQHVDMARFRPPKAAETGHAQAVRVPPVSGSLTRQARPPAKFPQNREFLAL